MKRCPECRRDYYDETLLYCLDDGTRLLEGPSRIDEPVTAILSTSDLKADELPTRPLIRQTDEENPQGADKARTNDLQRIPTRGLVGVIALAVLVAAGAFLGFRYFSPIPGEVGSIAVLPLENRSGSADADYLADGLADSLIYRLSQIPNLKVSPTSSVVRYKGQDLDVGKIAAELNVDAVMSGKLVQRGDDLSINIQLIDTRTEKLIWAEQYERKMADLLSTQREIASSIAKKLELKLAGDDAAGATKTYTTSNEAYQLYLKGRFNWSKRTEADIKRSIGFYDQAIAADPGFALAYAGLADSYQVLPSYTLDPPPEVTYPKARAAAEKALELDPSLAEPHAALGVVRHEYDWNFAEAEREFKRAIEINPQYPSAHQWYGEFLANMGRSDEAIAEAKKAQQLDPQSLIINAQLGRTYYVAGRFEDAIAQYEKTLEIDPNFSKVYRQMAEAYIQMGMYEEAIEAGRKKRLLDGVPADQVNAITAKVTESLRTGGVSGFWRKVLEYEKAAALQTQQPMSPLIVAVYLAGMGEKDQALNMIETALASGNRDLRFVQMKTDPIWLPLREEPRFKEVLKKIGFPPPV